jgi:hypothetical protein
LDRAPADAAWVRDAVKSRIRSSVGRQSFAWDRSALTVTVAFVFAFVWCCINGEALYASLGRPIVHNAILIL